MNEDDMMKSLGKEFGLAAISNDFEVNRQALADRVNELLRSEFDKLISILYRMDVGESKLKQQLQENPGTDAGLIIADLIIERHVQKRESKKNYTSNNEGSDEERW